ncbi:hypothetical protein LTR62_004759 [Meristemomyces frigidus]|uniref:Uncharacterized protein n=1 Tax=Meristemomyces frigidus TaxID=1508187 RepID=A0AAN7TLJ1_9PEZI|nr:hypothetical protein LTR62_004759 [Meristemomyces frigidus]
MAALFSTPFAVDGIREAVVAIQGVASAAGTLYTADGLAETFAERWAQAALGLSYGAMHQGPPILPPSRSVQGPVAHVPLVPLFLFLGLKTMYVLSVILLAIGAYCFTPETPSIKEQLSAKGLAASHFDEPGLLQQRLTGGREENLRPASTGDATKDAAVAGQPGADITAAGDKDDETTTDTPTLDAATQKRVGLIVRADGAWRFAVVLDGVWNGIRPVATDLIGLEAGRGALGGGGGGLYCLE